MTYVCLVFAFALSWWLTGSFRRYALARQILDLPNARSSHVAATPRGGGVAIVLSVLAPLVVLALRGAVPWPVAIAMLGGGSLVAIIGFADDLFRLPMRWRFLGHVAAATWVVVWLGGSPLLVAFGIESLGAMASRMVAVVYLVWLLNVTNFMDGIDGIAAVEAVSVGAGAVFIAIIVQPGSTLWVPPAIVASAALGFLLWNWPPAKIFMGDSGSAFLGLTLGVLSLQAAQVRPSLFWSWIILLGVFAVDATFTRVRRATYTLRFYEPHRDHAYQRAAAAVGAHRPVTLAVGAINLGWLLPIAWCVAAGLIGGVFGAAIAYVPLVGMAVWLKAGAVSAR